MPHTHWAREIGIPRGIQGNTRPTYVSGSRRFDNKRTSDVLRRSRSRRAIIVGRVENKMSQSRYGTCLLDMSRRDTLLRLVTCLDT